MENTAKKINETALLSVQELSVEFKTLAGTVQAVNKISFNLNENETLGIVGESGSGKSVTSLAIMGLLPSRNILTSGSVFFEGNDLLGMREKDFQKIRGNKISMIFQEPMSSLNPLYPVGKQIAETLVFHKKMAKSEAFHKAVELMRSTGIPAPEERAKQYPFQMSGGMCQRAMIAMALACDPKLLIADEPTTALDVTIQAQILKLLKDLKAHKGMSIIMITHDLGIVSDICDKVIVVYLGQIVEAASVRELFSQPLHPYTKGLIEALPRLGDSDKRLTAIEGSVPSPEEIPLGCAFHPRCKETCDRCRKETPPEFYKNNHMVRCWLYEAGGHQ